MNNKNLPRVTDILKGAGLIDFSYVPGKVMIPAQEFGTAFHLARQLWDKGTLDETSLSEPLIPYLEGYKKFKKDYGFVVTVNESEEQLVSIKYGFKGTPDLWPVIQGKRTLVDTKTSTSMYPATEIQTAGYEILLSENGIKINRRWGVQFKEDGTYNVKPYTEISDRGTFLNCLGVHNYKIRKGLL